jgi:hypothetical protein
MSKVRLAVHDEELGAELELEELSWRWLPFALVVEFARMALLATTPRDDEIQGRQWSTRGAERTPRGIESAARIMPRELCCV